MFKDQENGKIYQFVENDARRLIGIHEHYVEQGMSFESYKDLGMYLQTLLPKIQELEKEYLESQSFGEWISVDSKEKPLNGEVLICKDWKYVFSVFYGQETGFSDNGIQVEGITAWMPLPQPPISDDK